MADILALVGTVVGLLTAAEGAYDKIKEIRGLPQAFAEISLRLPLAREILDKVDKKYANLPLSKVGAIAPVIEDCRNNAESLKTILQKLQPKDSASSWSNIVNRYTSIIKSMGKKERVEDLIKKILQDTQQLANNEAIKAATSEELEKLENAIKHMNMVEKSVSDEALEDGKGVSITGTGPQNFQVGDNNKLYTHSGSGHVIENATFGASSESRKGKVLRALYCASYEDHKDRNPEAAPDTCLWVIEHPNFQRLIRNETARLLWISADPGCGKSVLARHLLDKELKSSCPSSRLIYFFFKDDSKTPVSMEKALSCLLHQLLKDGSDLFTEPILNSLEELGEGISGNFRVLWDTISRALSNMDAGETVCVLDGLDECKPTGWSRMAEAIGGLYREHSSLSLKFILLSRPYRHIERSLVILEDRIPTIRLSGEDPDEVDKISAEIDIVIKTRVELLSKELKLSEAEQLMIYQKLTQTPNRTYLWVSLVCNMLEGVEPLKRSSLLDAIDHIPQTVDDAYNEILRRTSDEKTTKNLLHMVVAAGRPLSVNEMATSFTVLEHPSLDNFEQNIQHPDLFRKAIRYLTGLFVVISQDRIYLIHQTAKKFLIQQDLNANDLAPTPTPDASLQWKSCLRPDESNRIMLDICVRYLVFLGDQRPVQAILDEPAEALEQYSTENALLNYAARHWTLHYRRTGSLRNTEISSLVQRLCDTTWLGCQVWFAQAYYLMFRGERGVRRTYSRPTVRQSLPSMNGIDSLALASCLGVHDVVRELIAKRGTSLNANTGRFKRSALGWAAKAGHSDIVRLFLNSRTTFGIGFLHLRGVRVDLEDSGGMTPLMHAAKNGHDMVVNLLMETGRAHPDAPDRFGRSPLSAAASHGHLLVVRCLLATGKVKPNLKDHNGWTPLMHAAYYGNLAVLECLLGTGKVEIDAECSCKRTPLSYAAGEGHTLIVESLLRTGRVDINSKCTNERTPLSYAAESGNLGVVDLLMGEENVDVNLKCSQFTAPLGYASKYSRALVVERILSSGSVNLEISGKELSTTSPLYLASVNGSTSVVFQLLDAGNMDINTTWRTSTGSDFTLLAGAAGGGHVDSIAALLAKSGNARSFSGLQHTKAFVAAINSRREGVVKYLLRVGEVDWSLKVEGGLTPRLIAHKYHSEKKRPRWEKDEIIELLEEHIKSMPDSGKALNDLESTILDSSDLLSLELDCMVSEGPSHSWRKCQRISR